MSLLALSRRIKFEDLADSQSMSPSELAVPMNLNSMGGASMAGSSSTTRQQIEASGTPEQYPDDMNVTGSDNHMGMGMQSFGDEARNASMITHMANM